MTDTTHTPEENLAFLRQLAHAGKEAPLMGGPYLIAGGAWFAAASLLQWPLLRDLLGLSLTQATFAWLIAAAGFALHLTVLIRRDRHKVENSANRVVNASWVGVGLGIFAFWLGVAAMAWQRGDAFVMNTISLQVLSVYGIAWMITGAATSGSPHQTSDGKSNVGMRQTGIRARRERNFTRAASSGSPVRTREYSHRAAAARRRASARNASSAAR